MINLLSQALVEGQTASKPGEFLLDIRRIRNVAARDQQLQSIRGKNAGSAELILRKGTPEEGDPQNRLIQIYPDLYQGTDIHVRQDALLTSLFGVASEDAVSRIRHNEALESASRRAKEKLTSLQAEFKAGLAPGEYLLVKAPFATLTGSREWMWVEVSTWKANGQISGLLKNEPVDVPGLHGGQVVNVNQEDVFDYLRVRPNGVTEGNETSRIIEAMQQAR